MTAEDLDKLRDNLANQLPGTMGGIVITVNPITKHWSLRHVNLGPGETADILRDCSLEVLKAMTKRLEGHGERQEGIDPGLLGKERT